MASTFKALCDLADWPEIPKQSQIPPKIEQIPVDGGEPTSEKAASMETTKRRIESAERLKATLHYNIQIILPDSRDSAVFDAIFKSLRDHLL